MKESKKPNLLDMSDEELSIHHKDISATVLANQAKMKSLKSTVVAKSDEIAM